MQLAQRLGERLRVADLLLLQARVALGRGQLDAARTSMRASLDEARAQAALGFELAALVALCEMAGASTADREALKDACARVKEGLDTRPVQRAKALAGL